MISILRGRYNTALNRHPQARRTQFSIGRDFGKRGTISIAPQARLGCRRRSYTRWVWGHTSPGNFEKIMHFAAFKTLS